MKAINPILGIQHSGLFSFWIWALAASVLVYLCDHPYKKPLDWNSIHLNMLIRFTVELVEIFGVCEEIPD